MSKKLTKRSKIKYRIRKSLSGSSERPRLAVFKSNKSIYAQLIDDVQGQTIASASSAGMKGTKLEQATLVGKAIADKAKAANIEKVVFDRSGYVYHGRIKSLADGAREAGIVF